MSATITGREARYKAYLDMLKEDFTPYAQLELLYPDGTVAEKITSEFIASGSVNVNFQNGTRRTASVTIENGRNQRFIGANSLWFGQQIRLSAGLILPDGTPYLLPQGIFYLNDPNHEFMPSSNILTLPLIDKWAQLDGTLFGNLEGNYVAVINSDIYEQVSAILNIDRGNGIPIDGTAPLLSSYFIDKTVTLPDGTTISVTKVPYEMRVEPSGNSYATVLLEFNKMLTGIIGYDNTGRLRIEPSNYDIDDLNKPLQWEFNLTEKEFLGGTYTPKMSEVFNVVQVIGDILNGYQAKGEAVNDDPASETSIYGSIGRKVKRIEDTTYYADTQCQELAEWHLKRCKALQYSISFSASPIYHLQENMLVGVANPENNFKVEPFLINGFSVPIGLGQMTINATSVNKINN